jgi:uncharacterized delta-60 repeat protein
VIIADLKHIKGETMKPNGLNDVGIVEFTSKPKPVGFPRACRRLTLWLWAICLVTILVMPAFAADGDLDPSFITGSGQNAGVQTIPEIRGRASYPTVSGAPYNGYSLLFGTFWGVNVGGPSPNNNCIARLKADGSLDTTFVNNQMLNGEIRSIYIYPHDDPNFPDKILIGGRFNAVSGSNYYSCLARLNADGLLDETFPQVIGYGAAVNTVAVQGSGNTGKILVGGYNLRLGDMDNGPLYQLFRLTYDGTLDDTFTHWSAPGGYINGIKIYSGDPVFGNDVRIFCSYPKNQDGSGGTYYMLLLNSNAARPDITVPVAFIGSETVDGPILNMANQSSDGKILIVGQFKHVYNTSTSSWVPRNRVARLGSDYRTLDTAYDVGVGPNGLVNAISPMKITAPVDDRMVVIGNFNTWNGASCGYITCLTTTGEVDSSFTPGTGAEDRIRSMNWKSDGTGGWIYGYFRHYNGQVRGGIAGLNGNGSYNSDFANVTAMAGFSGMVSSLATQTDGKILIGGDFSGVGGKYRGGMARINPDGSLDPSFKGGVDGIVNSVAVQADGKILVAGDFGQCQSYACTGLARLNPDGSFDTAFNPRLEAGDNSVPFINQVVLLANGQMMVVGNLWDNNGGYPAVRLNSNGTRDPSFNASQFSIPGTNWWSCHRLAVAGNKYLIAGGWDSDTAINAGGFLARLTDSGAVDIGFYPGSNSHIQTMDSDVEDLLVQGDGKIVVSGLFTHIVDGAGNPERRAIARFSANGLLDGTFTPSLTPPAGANTIIIAAMAGQPNGKILIEENFLNYVNNNYSYVSTQVARLNSNGSLDAGFNLGQATNGWFYPGAGNSILRLPNGKALIGGIFSQYNGTPAWSLVRIFASPANYNPGALLLLLIN